MATVLSLFLAAAVPATRAENAPKKETSAPAEKIPQVGVQALLQDSTKYAGKQIVLEGFVTDVCKRKGCWANIHDNDSDAKAQLRVKQDESDGAFKPFQPEVQGKTVHVTGEVKSTKIDADYLNKWEARIKEAQKKSAGAKEEKAEAADSTAVVLKQIAGFRERVAKSKDGYLTSVSLAATKWEVVAAK